MLIFGRGEGGFLSEFHGMTTHCDLLPISRSLSFQFWMIKMKVSSQPPPQGLLLVQNGGSEIPLTKAAEILQDDEMAFRRLFPASGGPVCLLQFKTVAQTKKRHLIVYT